MTAFLFSITLLLPTTTAIPGSARNPISSVAVFVRPLLLLLLIRTATACHIPARALPRVRPSTPAMAFAQDPGQARCESHHAGPRPLYRPPDASSHASQPFLHAIGSPWPDPDPFLTRLKASPYSLSASSAPALPKLHQPSSAELPLRSAFRAPPAGLPRYGPATASESSSAPLTNSCQRFWIDTDQTPSHLLPPAPGARNQASLWIKSLSPHLTQDWDKKKESEPAMCDSPLFGEFGLGIHTSLPGPLFPFGFDSYKDDPIDNLVDPGLTASTYSSSPNSSFPSPEQLCGSSPPSCHEFFPDAAAVAPDETVADNNNNNYNDTVVDKNSSHGNNAKSNTSKPSMTTPGSALASSASSTTTPAPAATAAPPPQPPANTSPIGTRTRKASSQNTDASVSTAQPRAKKQKTTITVKLEPQESQQRPQTQRQRQSSPPKRKPSRRGSTAKKEDVAQRTKNLERNRIAASKCRQKKKEWVVELEEKKVELENKHHKLRVEYFNLLDQVTGIKNELMAHAKCQDPNINFWIEKEAFKYVERCMDPAPERRPSMLGNGELNLRYGGKYS